MSGVPVALGDLSLAAPGFTLRLTGVHGAFLRRTRGRLLGRWFGLCTLVLETAGRRTGKPRHAPLAYLRDGDDLVVVASNAGADRPPGWWLNLLAAGHGTVHVAGERRRVRPVEVHGAERDRLWRRFADVAPVDHYERRAARRLPVVRLETSHGSLRARPYNPVILP